MEAPGVCNAKRGGVIVKATRLVAPATIVPEAGAVSVFGGKASCAGSDTGATKRAQSKLATLLPAVPMIAWGYAPGPAAVRGTQYHFGVAGR